MNRIENIIGLIKDDALPARRSLYVQEVLKIREMAMKPAEKDKGKEAELRESILEAIDIAYNYGFWMGWKYCEAENDTLPGKE